MTMLVQKREELAAKRKALAEVFASKPDLSFTEDEVGDIRAKNSELTDLGKEVEGLVEIDAIAAGVKSAGEREEAARRGGIVFPASGGATDKAPTAMKSIGDLFVESDAFTKYDKTQHRSPTVEIDLAEHYGEAISARGAKAAMDISGDIRYKATLTTTGFAPEAVRIPLIVTPGEQKITISDLFPSAATSQNAIPYMEETTTMNAAAETAEGDLKPESTLAFTERSAPVRKIATFLPVTDELFADVPAMRGYVDGRLRSFVQQREDSQLLNGDGNAPNLRGILATVGIQTQAKGADPVPDALYRAITKIFVNALLDATGVVMNANDWQDVRLLRTNEGIYIWGSPMDAGPERVWGLQVVKTTRIAEGTALVGAFRDGGQIYRRSELAFAVSDSHGDYFQRNLLAIRVEERLALVIYRPAGFCTVTGI